MFWVSGRMIRSLEYLCSEKVGRMMTGNYFIILYSLFNVTIKLWGLSGLEFSFSLICYVFKVHMDMGVLHAGKLMPF